MTDKTPRRKFLKNTAKGTIAMGIGLTSVGSLMESFSPQNNLNISPFETGFDQQPLPYSFNALESIIDAATMEIHYTKHAATYSKNLKEAVAGEGVNTNNVEDILKNVSKYTAKMRNNGGGHYNHEMFWKCMRPKQDNNKPAGKLLASIEKNFTSFENFKTQFSDAGKNRFGSGWAWLYQDNNKALKIGSTPNQDNPLMDVSDFKGVPLLGLDVWEHAYYLKYQNRRPEYLGAIWNAINWKKVAENFDAAK